MAANRDWIFDLLTKAKLAAGRGGWLKWLADNEKTLGFGERQAQYYLREPEARASDLARHAEAEKNRRNNVQKLGCSECGLEKATGYHIDGCSIAAAAGKHTVSRERREAVHAPPPKPKPVAPVSPNLRCGICEEIFPRDGKHTCSRLEIVDDGAGGKKTVLRVAEPKPERRVSPLAGSEGGRHDLEFVEPQVRTWLRQTGILAGKLRSCAANGRDRVIPPALQDEMKEALITMLHMMLMNEADARGESGGARAQELRKVAESVFEMETV
jgi:hypothetical protein